MRFSRIFSVFLATLLLSSVFALFLPSKASALSTSAAFENRSTIRLNSVSITQQDIDDGDINDEILDSITGSDKVSIINTTLNTLAGSVFTDGNIEDNDRTYTYSPNGCQSKIEFKDGDGNIWSFTEIRANFPRIGCTELTPGKDWTLSTSSLDQTKIEVWFEWVSEKSLRRVDGRYGNFNQNSTDPNVYESEEDQEEYLDFSSGNDLSAFYSNPNRNVSIEPASVANKSTPGVAPSATTEPDASCESGGGVLGWIMCPIAELLDGIVAWLDSTIQSLLIIDESKYSQDSNGLYTSWSRIRNIAYFLLVPAMLIMVIGTALGFEVFSAYTVKKALPRMVAATIFIALSWYICTFFIQVMNVIGTGVLGLLTNPFDSAESLRGALQAGGIVSGGDGSSTGNQIGLYAVLGTGAFIGFATGFVSIGIILSTLFSAAVVLGIVLLVLVAREMFIIMLLMAGPLAVLSWIFPGNDKPWKLWWGLFSKLLLMFPLVMALIAVGRIFASVTGEAGVGGGLGGKLLLTILIVGAYIIPYVAIPFTFKWVGGFFGNIAGMVNDKSKGILDRGSKYRAGRRQEGLNRFKTGTGSTFGQKNALTRGIGTRVGARTTGFGKSGKSKLDQLNRQSAVENIMKSDKWNGVNQDDNALHAGILLQDMNEMSALAHMKKSVADGGMGLEASEAKRAISAWKASKLGGRAAAVAAAQQLVSTGTGYRDLGHMTETLARASGGNASTATAMSGFANSEAKKVGRYDLAPSFGTLSGLVEQERKSKTGLRRGTAPSDAEIHAATVKASRGGDAVTILRGKPAEVENLTEALRVNLEDAHARGDMGEVLQTTAQIRQLDQSKGYASPQNQGHVNQLLKDTAHIRDPLAPVIVGIPPRRDPISGAVIPGTPPTDPALAEEWERLMPTRQNPNDPNMP